MIIYTVLDKVKELKFVKVFDSPYLADKYMKRVGHSKRFDIVKVVYDYV